MIKAAAVRIEPFLVYKRIFVKQLKCLLVKVSILQAW